jgi:hypothetical protein
MAMALYPATMKKAQQEIDSVCTSDTMPGFAQMKDLPYCFALVKEVFRFSIILLHRACFNCAHLVLRWSPAAPGGFPHYTDADDEYMGYAVCIANFCRPDAR